MMWRRTGISLALLLLIRESSGCLPSDPPRTFSAPSVQFQQAPQPPQLPVAAQSGGGFVQDGLGAALPRPAVAGAANEAVAQPVGGGQSHQPSVLQYLLGRQISLSEFTADGYNAEGGGPVNAGSSLTCRADGTPCCWANVPPPDDQLDWQIATGTPDAVHFENVPRPEGSYLIAYARGAAPSDEAQLASCAIACASTPITIRAKHWQSDNVLLQVCQRESFPNSVNFNPLLNCQEFPLADGFRITEVVLPKASLIDIVFVASNFVGENGDMAILDDIEVFYDGSGQECLQNGARAPEQFATDQNAAIASSVEEAAEAAAAASFVGTEAAQVAHRLTLETNSAGKTATLDVAPPVKLPTPIQAAALPEVAGVSQRANAGGHRAAVPLPPPAVNPSGNHDQDEAHYSFDSKHVRALGKATFKEREASKKLKAVSSAEKRGLTKDAPSSSSESSSLPPEPIHSARPVCTAISCNFDNGTTCSYQDAHQTQSIRGLTTKFQIVNGQFMNKVTGIKSGKKENYYAATFLFPREMAGLETATEPFVKEQRMRFNYYEGTHGVQLKGCCGQVEECPFQSDKFVSVSDRVWKSGSLTCPLGTEKVIFLCENTRTNQGACAIDNIEMIRTDGDFEKAAPLC